MKFTGASTRGVVFIALGAAMLFAGSMGLDPGAKLADDGDPFGDPGETVPMMASFFALGIISTIAGIRLLRRRSK